MVRLTLQLSTMLAIFSFILCIPTERKGPRKNEASSDLFLGCLLKLGNSLKHRGRNLFEALQFFNDAKGCLAILDDIRSKCGEVMKPSLPDFGLSGSNIVVVRRACNSVISVENVTVIVRNAIYKYLNGAGAALEAGPTTQADILEYAFLFPKYFGTENRWHSECEQLTDESVKETNLKLSLRNIMYGCQVFTS